MMKKKAYPPYRAPGEVLEDLPVKEKKEEKEKMNLSDDVWTGILVSASIIGAFLLIPFLVAIEEGKVIMIATTGALVVVFAAIIYRALKGLSQS
jgi:1-deoxy-D-xylulose 5-phosphate reductoisomerase